MGVCVLVCMHACVGRVLMKGVGLVSAGGARASVITQGPAREDHRREQLGRRHAGNGMGSHTQQHQQHTQQQCTQTHIISSSPQNVDLLR